jgi:hypothetical protein
MPASTGPTAWAATRGVVAAMAMTGFRQLTQGLGLVERTPPEAVLQETAPGLFYRVPLERRRALVEAAHWGYGALAGAAFGALPARWRQPAWAGPAYGWVVWAVFEAGIGPALGLTRQPRHGPVQSTMLLLDHLLYGAIVAGEAGSAVRRDRRRTAAERRPTATERRRTAAGPRRSAGVPTRAARVDLSGSG